MIESYFPQPQGVADGCLQHPHESHEVLLFLFIHVMTSIANPTPRFVILCFIPRLLSCETAIIFISYATPGSF